MLFFFPIIMQNPNLSILYRCVTRLIPRDDDINEYYGNDLLSISDDSNFCFYQKVMELPGFHELLMSMSLRIVFKETRDYAPGIDKDFIVLRPAPKTAQMHFSGYFMTFDDLFRLSDMFVIRPRKLRETISVCGIQPSVEYRLRTRHGFATEEARIYAIIEKRTEDIKLEYCQDKMDRVVRWAVNKYHSMYGDVEYDIWRIKVPLKSNIRKDASFLYGGYVVDSIAPENLILTNTIKYGEKLSDAVKLKKLNSIRKLRERWDI